ncbi:RIP metalloprotease RseP [Magnetospira sp. QH-2]|uniref:RIP metalloprotease RseP n=1 Tax=Magnetospira sp. (strain QH-2) TaxID=1288970 RepID=UPI0003E81271|nr:RIP metalloprotease RseP [Magnetospira sp. QH-2]CCQ73981.1 Putative membrane-associated zinc metallopeptidase, Peptidase M50 [Magnetospira sp. QH-2]
MEFVGSVPYYVIVFLFVLSVLVFVHELGHYLVARWSGVRIEVFSIGFGPEIKGWNDQHGTRWKVSAIPLGGYVKMFGETGDTTDDGQGGERLMTDEEKDGSFQHKPLGKRAAVVAAGPFANFAFTIVALTILFWAVGHPRPMAAVGTVQEGSAAYEAGFESGDKILSIAGQDVRWFDDLKAIVEVNPGKDLDFQISRKDTILTLTAVPKSREVGGESKGFLGVSPDASQIETETYGPLEAVGAGFEKSWVMTTQILGYVGELITGNRGSEDLGGPLMIAKMSGDVAQGGLSNLVFFMAALSLNLGLINLFPIPMLDGGHLVFYGIEALRGKPLGERAQEYGFRFGLVLVLALMVFATWNDLVNMNVFQFFKDLVS